MIFWKDGKCLITCLFRWRGYPEALRAVGHLNHSKARPFAFYFQHSIRWSSAFWIIFPSKKYWNANARQTFRNNYWHSSLINISKKCPKKKTFTRLLQIVFKFSTIITQQIERTILFCLVRVGCWTLLLCTFNTTISTLNRLIGVI